MAVRDGPRGWCPVTRAHRPPRTRDEMRAAIERRIREQDPLDAQTQRELAAALGIRPRRTVRGVVTGVLAWLTTYTKGPR